MSGSVALSLVEFSTGSQGKPCSAIPQTAFHSLTILMYEFFCLDLNKVSIGINLKEAHTHCCTLYVSV